jgi:micrococcal nuclease
MEPSRRPRGALVVALVAVGLVLATVASLVLAPVVAGVVDGLRVLGGAGVDVAEPAGPRRGPGTEVDREPTGAWPVPADAQPAVVDRIVDGDTLRVRVAQPGGPIPPTDSVRVRLLNVDTPELDHPQRGEDCGAREATDYLEALAPAGSRVHLVADVEDRDRYDRPLRGVWTEDGRFVNAELVRAGWAEVVLFEPNDRFHAPLLELEVAARDEGRGAWGVCGGFPG